MKKLFISTTLSVFILFGAIGLVNAHNWSPSEAYYIPNWGAMSTPSNSTKQKTKSDTYGYMTVLADQSTFSKYGDFCTTGKTRLTNNKYKIYKNANTKMWWSDTEYRGNFKARACGETWEPGMNTIFIMAQYCE